MRVLRIVILALTALAAACAPRHAVMRGAGIGLGAMDVPVDGPFRILFVGPENDAPERAQPTIVYSRPVRALGLPEDATGEPPANVRREGSGAVAGAWTWFGDSTAVFTPRVPFDRATVYRIEPLPVRARDGSVSTGAAGTTFTTPRPRLTAASYRHDDATGRHLVMLDFDDAIAPEVLRAAIRVEGRGPDGVRGISYRSEDPTNDAPREHWDLVVDPAVVRLEDVAVTASTLLRGTSGPLAAASATRLPLDGAGPLAITVTCGDARIDVRAVALRCESSASGAGEIIAELSKGVGGRDLTRHLVVGPGARPNARELSLLEHADEVTRIDLGALVDAAPGRSYRVTFEAGLVTSDKEVLAADRVLEIQVTDLPPRLAGRDLEGADVVVEAARPSIPIHLLATNVAAFEATWAPLDETSLVPFLYREHRGASAALRALPGNTTTRLVPRAKRNEAVDLVATVAPERTRGAAGAFAFATEGGGAPDTLHVLSVTDLGVTTKWSPHGSLVWVTTLSTAAPVAGATVALRRVHREGPDAEPVTTSVVTVTTDADGIAVLPVASMQPFVASEDEALLVVKHDADWTYARPPALDRSLLGATGDVFVERGLYRPGETMLVKGYFRRPGATGLVTLAGAKVSLEALDADGKPFHAATRTLDAFGAFSSEIPIPRTVRFGFGRVRARIGDALPPASATRERRDPASEATDRFLVAEYRTAEIEVHAHVERPAYVRGQTARLVTSGTYLFGAPMTKVPVDIEVRRHRTTFHPPGLEAFATSEGWLDDAPDDALLAPLKGLLDDAGHAAFAVPLATRTTTTPDQVVFDASIEDVTKAYAAGATEVALVHPSDIYLGVKTTDGDAPSVGKPVRVELVAASIDGARRGGIRTHLELLAIGNREERTPTGATCDVVTDAPKVVGCDLAVTKAGPYWIDATAVDDAGRALAAAVRIHVSSVAPRPAPPPRVVPTPPTPALTFDEECARRSVSGSDLDLSAGFLDPVAVGTSIHACLRGGGDPSLFTLEREGLLRRDAPRVLGRTGELLTIPVEEAFYPDVQVVLTSVHARTMPFPTRATAPGIGSPFARRSSTRLEVAAPEKKLDVVITAPTGPVAPGTEVDVGVHVTTAEGRPAPSQVTLWAVDDGIVLLAPKRVPTPLDVFGVARGSDVLENDTRANVFWEHVGVHSVKSPSLRQGSTMVSPRDSIGRSVFRPTAWFLPDLITDATGHAIAHVKLPDNLTTWKVFAVAATTGDAFGSAEASFVANRPLALRPALPRFLRTGDHFEAAVVVDSFAKEPVTVTVTSAVTGVLSAPAARPVRTVVPPSGHVALRFPVEARAVGAGTIGFQVTSARARDAVTIAEDVRPVTTVETTVVSGTIPRTGSSVVLREPVGDLSTARSDVGGFDYRVSTTPLVGLAEGLGDLVEYPYGCTEQLASRLVPLLRLRGLARELGVVLPANVEISVRSSVASLLTHQREDGGFGFWRDSQKSEPWLTALALSALLRADAGGLSVPASVPDRARAWLERKAPPEPLDPGSLALFEDTLATLGRPRIAELRALAARPDLPLFGQALVAHALATSDPALARAVVERAASHVLRSGAQATFVDEASTPARATLSSDTRTTAMMLRAIVATEPGSSLVPPIVRGLLAQRKNGRWSTTQATSWAVEALADARPLLAPAGGRSRAQLLFDERPVATATFAGLAAGETATATVPMSRLLGAPGAPLGFGSDGTRSLYFEGTLRFARRAPPPLPFTHGITLARGMHRLGDDSTDFRVGDYVVVEIAVTSPVARDLVVLDDPIPAGFEAVNQVFLNQEKRGFVDDPAAGIVSHRELRDDRVLTFFDALPAGTTRTRYVLRVVAAGQFAVPAAKAECMYAPDVYGRTGASTVAAR